MFNLVLSVFFIFWTFLACLVSAIIFAFFKTWLLDVPPLYCFNNVFLFALVNLGVTAFNCLLRVTRASALCCAFMPAFLDATFLSNWFNVAPLVRNLFSNCFLLVLFSAVFDM